MIIYGPATYINPTEFGGKAPKGSARRIPYVPLCTCAQNNKGMTCGGGVSKETEERIGKIQSQQKKTVKKVKAVESRLSAVERKTSETYTRKQVDEKVKAVAANTYTKTEVDSAVRAVTANTYTKTEVDNKDRYLQEQIDNIDMNLTTYSKTEIDRMLGDIVSAQKDVDKKQDEEIVKVEDFTFSWDEY